MIKQCIECSTCGLKKYAISSGHRPHLDLQFHLSELKWAGSTRDAKCFHYYCSECKLSNPKAIDIESIGEMIERRVSEDEEERKAAIKRLKLTPTRK